MAQIQELLDVMARLRHPQEGCAWDIEQDFASIAPYTIEEAYEVADAIERSDMDDLRDELGDLLLQVVFHSQMAREDNHFGFADVVQGIVDKMIRRHPHVFGDADGNIPQYDSTEDLNRAWDAQKTRERAAAANGSSASPPSAIDGVALGLPALTRAEKIQKRAARVGFDWQEIPPVLDKITEETAEVMAAIDEADQDQIEDELGDLLFAVVNLSRHVKVDPEKALRRATTKFSTRFRAVEAKCDAQSLVLADQPLSVLDQLWEEVKDQQRAG